MKTIKIAACSVVSAGLIGLAYLLIKTWGVNLTTVTGFVFITIAVLVVCGELVFISAHPEHANLFNNLFPLAVTYMIVNGAITAVFIYCMIKGYGSLQPIWHIAIEIIFAIGIATQIFMTCMDYFKPNDEELKDLYRQVYGDDYKE